MSRFATPLFVLLMTGVTVVRAAAPLPLQRIARLALPGPPARFDYQSLDVPAGRLYLNEMGTGQLLVFDIRKRNLLARLRGFSDATGVLAVPMLHRVYVSSPGDLWDKAVGGGRVIVIDSRSLKRVGAVDVGRFPDGLSFVPKLGRVFVSDEVGGELSVFNAVTLKPIGSVSLGGEAGMNAYDPIGDRVWVNDQSDRRLLALNPQSLAITTRIELPLSCRHNHGLLLDAADRLAFIGCDGNARLLLFDLALRKILGVYPVGKDPDVMAYDARRRLLYVASESGVLSLFRLDDTRSLHELGSAWLGDNAHSVSVDPASGESYFPIRDDGGHPALWIERPRSSSPSR